MQNSILVLVDISAALAESSLENNIYLVDTYQAVGSRGVGTASMVSSVIGVHNPDGSQATEAVLNWLGCGISALPPTLPRSYHLRAAHRAYDRALVAQLATAENDDEIVDILSGHDEEYGLYGTEQSTVPDLPIDLRLETGAFVSSDDIEYASYVNPVILNIRGEAVENGVIFPALYGSPDFYTDGWYWSAAVDTSKVGLHSYIMDIQLLRPVKTRGTLSWQPEVYSFTAYFEITWTTLVNGFNGTFQPGLLPLAHPCPGVNGGI